MTTRRIYRVTRGETVRLELEKPSAALPDPAPQGKPAPDSPRGSLFTEDEAGRYIRRKSKLTIEFYDLGTRLRSVPPSAFDAKRVRLSTELSKPSRDDSFYNEYVEIESEIAGKRVATQHGVRFEISEQEISERNRRLVGSRGSGSTDESDPFATTEANVSGRKLPNAMPIPFASDLLIDVWLDETRYVVGSRPNYLDGSAGENPDAWQGRKPSEADKTEQWNQFNLESGAAKVSGYIEPVEASVRHLHVDTGGNVETTDDNQKNPQQRVVGYYEWFDTADTASFKITREPEFAAPAAEFRLRQAEIGIYLVPRLMVWRANYEFRYSRTFINWYDEYFGTSGQYGYPTGTILYENYPLNMIENTGEPHNGFRFGGRIPVYPRLPQGGAPSNDNLSPYLSRSPVANTVRSLSEMAFHAIPKTYQDYVSNPYAGDEPEVVEIPLTALGNPQIYGRVNAEEPVGLGEIYSMAGMLVSVLKVGTTLFYVWRKVNEERISSPIIDAELEIDEWDVKKDSGGTPY